MALKTTTSLFSNEYFDIVSEMILKAHNDKSVYIRRTSNFAIFKILKNSEISESQKETLLKYLEANLDDFLYSSGCAIIFYSYVSLYRFIQ